jgi:hypothetical protein
MVVRVERSAGRATDETALGGRRSRSASVCESCYATALFPTVYVTTTCLMCSSVPVPVLAFYVRLLYQQVSRTVCTVLLARTANVRAKNPIRDGTV